MLILERETFPRDHIGESQLPPISVVLDELGCWDKVEAADFPIKIGATFRWGKTPELWDFEFLPLAEFTDEPRPAKFVGQRRYTAFQVERAKYDPNPPRPRAGARLRGPSGVSGEAGARHRRPRRRPRARGWRAGRRPALRRRVGPRRHPPPGPGHRNRLPTKLRNVAIWDYRENADWAVHIGIGGTRIQVRSVGDGWIWFIPLGPTRTSIGLVCPAEHYKQSGRSAEERATRRGRIETTKDWSFLAERTTGENGCSWASRRASPIRTSRPASP